MWWINSITKKICVSCWAAYILQDDTRSLQYQVWQKLYGETSFSRICWPRNFLLLILPEIHHAVTISSLWTLPLLTSHFHLVPPRGFSLSDFTTKIMYAVTITYRVLHARLMSSSIWSHQQYLVNSKINLIGHFLRTFYSPVLQYEGSLTQPGSFPHIINRTSAILIHWMVPDVLPCDTGMCFCTISLPIYMQQRYLLEI